MQLTLQPFRAAWSSSAVLTSAMQLISCLAVATAASLQLHDVNGHRPSLGSNQGQNHRPMKQAQLVAKDASSHSKQMLPQEVTSRQNHDHFQVHNFTSNTNSDSLHRNLSFILNKPEMCDKDTFLVIIVCSSAENFQQRTAIRETWGSVAMQPNLGAKVVFLLGVPSQSQFHQNTLDIQQEILREDSQFGDIVQSNFEDSYRNLSLKSVSMLQWVKSHCGSVRFLLKTDDDVFINTRTLLNDLHNIVHRRFIMGNIIAGAEPIQDRTSKWYTPRHLYPGSRYPKYISGTAYVISGDLISDLYQVAKDSELFLWEDIFITGMCAQKLRDVTHVFNAKFGYKKRISDPCLFQMLITGHRMSPDELRRLWIRISDPELKCPYSVK